MFLEIKDLKKGFGSGDSRTEVLRGIDFSVEKGEFCVLLGPSGSGKSTLLNIIGGIDEPDEGYISIDGEKTGDMKEKALTLYRRKHLGYVFQMYNLIPNLNVKENIEVGAYLSDKALDIDELLHTLGLYEHRHKLPNQLSGGQQQRIALARALVISPDVLLMDIRMSPMSGLEASEEILKEKPEAKILLLTTFSDDEYIVKALKCGVKGYLLKQDYASILPAIRAVCTGQTVFGTQIISRLPELLERKSAFDYETYEITEKERDVMKLVADGKSNKEIAGEMFLSEGTIRNYISGILDKLNLRDRTQLAVFYLRNCT